MAEGRDAGSGAPRPEAGVVVGPGDVASDHALLALLGHAPMATLVLDDRRRVLLANAAAAALGPARVGMGLPEATPGLADALAPLVEAALVAGRGADRTVVRSVRGTDRQRQYWQVSAFPVDRVDGTRLGVALFLSDVSEERRIARRLTDSVARLDVTLSAGGLATWDWDLLRSEAGWGGTVEQAIGLRPDRTDRRPESFLAAIHPDDRDEHRRKLIAAAQGAADFHNEVRLARDDGEVRWIEVRGRVVTATDGTPRRMIGVVADITERRLLEEIKARLLDREHQVRLEAEQARERLSLVAEVGATLMSRLDTQWVFEALPALLVPRVCDWCVLDVIGESGEMEAVALLHAEPGGEADVLAMRRWRRDAGGDGLWSVRRSMRSGRAELVVEITDEDLAGAAVDADHLALLRRLAPRSAITAPFVAHGEVLGGITVVATHDRRFEPDDLTLMENLADRVAMAVENARLFESRSQVARALQQTLLPPILPAIPGVDVVARYRVATAGIDIGGDFYDAFPIDPSTWALVVGDVCGKGAEAAAVTGLFRHTLRAVALDARSPAQVLRTTNDAILGQIDDTRFCTAVFIALHLGLADTAAPGAVARAVVACGGHPRPILVRADGTVSTVEVTGTLLGVLPEPVLREVTVDLHPGDAIVLYTDGVTEARRGDEQFGEARLADVLREASADAAFQAADLADRVEQAVDAFREGAPGDDIAVVVLRMDAATP